FKGRAAIRIWFVIPLRSWNCLYHRARGAVFSLKVWQTDRVQKKAGLFGLYSLGHKIPFTKDLPASISLFIPPCPLAFQKFCLSLLARIFGAWFCLRFPIPSCPLFLCVSIHWPNSRLILSSPYPRVSVVDFVLGLILVLILLLFLLTTKY